MNNPLAQFTNKYSLSKTLRFELIPQGTTLENINNKGLLLQDQNRANSYQEMKKTIDEYHKFFIELALKSVSLESLESYAAMYYLPKENKDLVIFSKIKENLRKEITKKFNEGEAKNLFKNLFSKELIKDDLEIWIKAHKPDLFYDSGFKNFTTYFLGFHENRRNIYSAEEISTGIAYRLIHENLPKFLDNIKIYNDIILKHPSFDFSNTLIGLEEILGGETLLEIFSINYYNQLLTQKWITYFNCIIGGYSTENGKKIQGLNECINQYNQLQKEKSNRIPKFKLLYKQILSDRISVSFQEQNFKNDNEVFKAIVNFYNSNLIAFEKDGVTFNILTKLKEIVSQISEYDTEKIYLRNDTSLTTISQKIFGDYSVFKSAISCYYETKVDAKFSEKINKKGISEATADKLTKEKDKWAGKYISIKTLQNCLDEYVNTQELDNEVNKYYSKTIVADYFKNNFSFQKPVKDGSSKNYDFVSHIKEQYKGVEGFLNIEKQDANTLKQDKERVHQIKMFLDSVKDLLWFVKPLQCNDDNYSDKDKAFYAEFDEMFAQLNLLIPLYNKVRNYVTQKPYETTKIKLNFENAQLLNGWDQNKEKDNSAILLRKEDAYYLAIMDKKANKIFENAPSSDDGNYEKMNYKLLPGANKMLPKVIFSDKNISYFNPSAEVQRIRNTATHSKNGEPQPDFIKGDFSLIDCHVLIDFFKESLAKHEDWKHLAFNFHQPNLITTSVDFTGKWNTKAIKSHSILFLKNISAKKWRQASCFFFKFITKIFPNLVRVHQTCIHFIGKNFLIQKTLMM